MRALSVHVAVVTTAQLRDGKIDQRVSTPLRSRPRLSTGHPVTERIDRGLHQRPAFGVELTTQHEHAAVGLLALEPATLVRPVVVGEHAIGVEAQPGDLGEGAHRPGVSVSAAPTRMPSSGATCSTPTSSARWAIMVTLLKEARPARALSRVAGSSPSVRARWTRYAAALAVMPPQRRSQDTVLPPPSAWAPRS